MNTNSGLKEVINILKSKQFGKLFSGDTDNTFIQFFRYCFVGGLATIADWGTSAVFFYLIFKIRYAVAANTISFIVGLFVNYILSTLWIFKNSKVNSKIAEFIGFAAIGLVGLGLTALITVLFRMLLANQTSAYQIIGKIVSTAIAFLWNFFARKFLLYSKKGDK